MRYLASTATSKRRAVAPSSRPSFTTSFASTENPISDSNRFYKTTNWWAEVKTESGNAWGLNGPNNAFDDAYAIIAGATGDYELSATVFRDASINTGTTHEIELNFNFKETDGGLGIRGMEGLFAHDGNVQCFIWTHGPDGDTNFVEKSSSAGAPDGIISNGSVIKARKVGSVLTLYKNDVLLGTFTDSTYTDGEAAIAFFTRPTGDSADFCISALTVTPL